MALTKRMKTPPTFQRSFASHPRAGLLINPTNPRLIFRYSKTKGDFLCDRCGEIYTGRIDHVFMGTFCRCPKTLVNSLASHPAAKYLLPQYNARHYHRSSKKYAEFRCPHCRQVYRARIDHVSEGSWCSCKKRKTERKIHTRLQPTYRIVRQKNSQIWVISNSIFTLYPLKLSLNVTAINTFMTLPFSKPHAVWFSRTIWIKFSQPSLWGILFFGYPNKAWPGTPSTGKVGFTGPCCIRAH